MLPRFRAGEHSSCRVLNVLQSFQGLDGESKQEGVALVQSSGNKGVQQGV